MNLASPVFSDCTDILVVWENILTKEQKENQ